MPVMKDKGKNGNEGIFQKLMYSVWDKLKSRIKTGGMGNQ